MAEDNTAAGADRHNTVVVVAAVVAVVVFYSKTVLHPFAPLLLLLLHTVPGRVSCHAGGVWSPPSSSLRYTLHQNAKRIDTSDVMCVMMME